MFFDARNGINAKSGNINHDLLKCKSIIKVCTAQLFGKIGTETITTFLFGPVELFISGFNQMGRSVFRAHLSDAHGYGDGGRFLEKALWTLSG